jgi:hypothetical protein
LNTYPVCPTISSFECKHFSAILVNINFLSYNKFLATGALHTYNHST